MVWSIPLLFIILLGCIDKQHHRIYRIYGYALGTSYSIKYIGVKKQETKFRRAIDSLFHCMDRSMSTYLPESLISRSNSGDTSVVFDSYFCHVFRKSKEIYSKTDGFFDPTVGTLRDLLSFGEMLPEKFPTQLAQKRMKYIGFDKVILNSQRKLSKNLSEIQLDFNAIAKGYAVDIIAHYMHTQRVVDFLIEVGGEVYAQGKNLTQKHWRVGVEKPYQELKNGRVLQAIVALQNESLATSGNYRKYYLTEGGKKIVHTVNPKTGLPFPNDMRSASVIAKDCMTADAYATAFMAMGVEKSKEIIEKVKEIEVFFIYEDREERTLKNFFTPGFRDRIIDLYP